MKMAHSPYNINSPSGFLGAAHGPFHSEGQTGADMTLRIGLDRLNHRKALLGSFDRFRRDVDTREKIAGWYVMHNRRSRS